MGARRRGSRLRLRDIRRRALLPRATECTDVRGHISWRTHVSRVCTNQNEPQNVSSASSPVLRRCLRDKLKENQTGGGLSTRSMSVYERRR
ncbi:hypothetical protein NQZ68_028640 [Dissostichus eleginoides]|nr:hypothetical protein NQZ68_028640 [Dissostichus eleginoides]